MRKDLLLVAYFSSLDFQGLSQESNFSCSLVIELA